MHCNDNKITMARPLVLSTWCPGRTTALYVAAAALEMSTDVGWWAHWHPTAAADYQSWCRAQAALYVAIHCPNYSRYKSTQALQVGVVFCS